MNLTLDFTSLIFTLGHRHTASADKLASPEHPHICLDSCAHSPLYCPCLHRELKDADHPLSRQLLTTGGNKITCKTFSMENCQSCHPTPGSNFWKQLCNGYESYNCIPDTRLDHTAAKQQAPHMPSTTGREPKQLQFLGLTQSVMFV